MITLLGFVWAEILLKSGKDVGKRYIPAILANTGWRSARSAVPSIAIFRPLLLESLTWTL
jgi:hypothetical protein